MHIFRTNFRQALEYSKASIGLSFVELIINYLLLSVSCSVLAYADDIKIYNRHSGRLNHLSS